MNEKFYKVRLDWDEYGRYEGDEHLEEGLYDATSATHAAEMHVKELVDCDEVEDGQAFELFVRAPNTKRSVRVKVRASLEPTFHGLVFTRRKATA